MNLFDFISYKDGVLHFDGVSVKNLAQNFGTPLYVYSRRILERNYKEFSDAFSEALIAYAVKSNSNLTLLKILSELGSGADTVSAGEIFRALKAGIPAEKIVFAGVGKGAQEIEYALKKGILMFNVESEDELLKINEVAKSLKKKAQIAFRVNPDVDPKTHPHISTGLKNSKFGVPMKEAFRLYKLASSLDWVEPKGIHFHIGSQIKDLSAFSEAAQKISALAEKLLNEKIQINYLDIGGGLAVPYRPGEKVPSVYELKAALDPYVSKLPVKLIVEPGRRISATAGILLCKLLYIKKTPSKTFYVVDCGMNDLLRPALYNAYHHVLPESTSEEKVTVDVVGPVCESADVLAKEVEISSLKHESVLAVLTAGAYGFCMSSNYNSRPRAAEVLIEPEGRVRLIRRRETFEDLIRLEI